MELTTKLVKKIQPLILLALLLFIQSNINAQPNFKEVLTESTALHGAGVSAIVVQNGKTLFKGSAGMANIELNIAMQNHHVHRIASITKQFTAAAILLLQEQGKLSVKDTLKKYFPDFPTEGHTVTLEHLLKHTSGLNNYTNSDETMTKRIPLPVTLEEMIDLFSTEPMLFAPNEQFAYSNTGYVLLGAIIEQLSGMSYGDFVKKHIFSKLGMTNSAIGGRQLVSNRAYPYTIEDGQIVNARPIDMQWPHAAGMLLSTVEDLAKWNTALHTNKLLSSESYEQLIRRGELSTATPTHYAMGLGFRPLADQEAIGHYGGINGFATAAMYLPKDKIFVVVLANSDNTNVGLIMEKLFAVALNISLPNPSPADINESTLKTWLGEYTVDENTTRKLYSENGKFFTLREGEQALEAIPTSGSRFYYPNSTSYFDLVSEDGVTKMKMYQNLSRYPSIAVKQN